MSMQKVSNTHLVQRESTGKKSVKNVLVALLLYID